MHEYKASDVRPLGVEIRSLNNTINRYLSVTRPVSEKDVTGGNLGIIMFLAQNLDREIFPQDIERRCSITRSTSSRVLRLMERKGLIVRQSVERDARLKRIVPTDKALDMADALCENADRMERMMVQGLSDAEVATLRHALDVMHRNLLATVKVGEGSCATPTDEQETPDTAAKKKSESSDNKNGRTISRKGE